MSNEHKGYTDVPFVRACPLCYSPPRLLRQLMARNVCPWEYMVPVILYQVYHLSLPDIQQACNVHSVKDTVPYRRGAYENPTKVQPRRLQEGGGIGWAGSREHRGERGRGERGGDWGG